MLSSALLWFNSRPVPLQDGLRQFAEDEGISGGAIVTFRNGKIDKEFAFGVQLDRARTAVTLETRFPIASLTKPITASTIRSLIKSGNIKLDEKITQLVPEVHFDDRRFSQVTVRQLLQHTSGLPASNDADPLFTAAGHVRSCSEAIAGASTRPLSRAPGQDIRYSNVGYCLLGLVISKAVGKPYEVAVMEKVLIPSSADSLTMGPIDDSEAARWTARPIAEWRSLSSVGGWFADARSLAKFVAKDVRCREIAHPPEAPYSSSYYGLGWRVWPTASSYELTHTGILPETFSFALGRPDGSAAVALFNGPVHDRDVATDRLRKLFSNYL